MTTNTSGTVLALDIGGRRIGVAVAGLHARLPRPLETIDVTATDPAARLKQLIAEHGAVQLVAGLPRGLEGQVTAQTAEVQRVGTELAETCGLPLHWQDEAATSLKAKEELAAKGEYAKGDVDKLAAMYILEDWLAGQGA